MSTVLDQHYLTVAEAADRLRVNPSTIRRWIVQGRLPASRLGGRRLALKESDVAAMITPLDGMWDDPLPTTPDGRPALPPLTPAQRQRALAALENARRTRKELFERRGGVLFPPSWELLNEARDDRTEQLP